jgi:D-serine deaminase-like pyridoxal phosphate-dependent protein
MAFTDPLSEPVLLLDEMRARRNIDRMVARARRAGVRLRPHFKTHQSHEIGRWFRDAGVTAATVSSLAMAEYFAADGWDDLTLAFPFHPGMRERVEALSARMRFAIVAADPLAFEGVRFAHAPETWIKIDVGARRTGVPDSDIEGVVAVAEAIRRACGRPPRGLLTHAGHSYAARGARAVLAVHEDSLRRLADLRSRLPHWLAALEISVGDTPTCSLAEDFPGANEIRPGNFVFYDLSQLEIGACGAEDIAVVMACPVVARHPERGRIVIHGGAVHFSRESLAIDGEPCFGLALSGGDNGWGAPERALRLVALSQEHGVLAAGPEHFDTLRPGDGVLIAPVHSCLTADVMRGYRLTDSGRAVAMMARG